MIDIISYVAQGIVNDIIYIPIELALVFILVKFLFHQDINKMLSAQKDKRGMYITAEDFGDNGLSSGSLTISINTLMNAGQLFILQDENVKLKAEIEKYKEILKKVKSNE